jgi:hypothetical protein
MKPRGDKKVYTMRNQRTRPAKRKSTTPIIGVLTVCVLTVLGSLYYGIPAMAGTKFASHRHALAARTISLNENGELHLTSKHNFTLNEKGSASGTASGAIYVHLTAVSSTRVTAEVNIYPKGGSITGFGTASYHRLSTTASFSGSMSINRGTGTYAHIHGSGLSFSGTVAESSKDAITVHVSGNVSD